GAEEQLRKNPGQSEPYNNLAKALARRARETGDPQFLAQAEAAVRKSLVAEPDNFEALKARVMILLGRREYPAALDLARALNKRIPDDVLVYGLVADACLALGDYQDAETSAQWMLDLRRGNLPGMIRGAELRAAWGDINGAIEWFTSVFKLTGAAEAEERAWLLSQIARLRTGSGKPDVAAGLATQALAIFPDYYIALEALGEAKSAQGADSDAAAI